MGGRWPLVCVRWMGKLVMEAICVCVCVCVCGGGGMLISFCCLGMDG